jgi:hypothetical protein
MRSTEPRGLSGVAYAAALALLACISNSSAIAAELKSAQCRIAGDVILQGLPAEWQPFRKFVMDCPVRSPAGSRALSVIAVSAERYYRQLPSGATMVKMPKPLLYSRQRTIIGELPLNFPDDPPAELHVTFTDWHGGFPNLIKLHVQDPAAAGNRDLAPLHWDAAAQRYTATTQ